MTVDKIKHNKILVTLCNDDMRDFSLDYNTMSLNDSHSRKNLMQVLQLACFEIGLEIKGKSMVVEAVPTVDGCMLLITLEEIQGKKFRLKNSGGCNCYELGDSKSFLDIIAMLYRQNVCCNKNSAYESNGVYYLVLEYPAVPKRFRGILREYATRCGGNIFAAGLRENAREICRTNAIAVIGRFL